MHSLPSSDSDISDGVEVTPENLVVSVDLVSESVHAVQDNLDLVSCDLERACCESALQNVSPSENCRTL